MEDTGPMEGKDGGMDTEENMDTNNSVRRSERNCQPPKQLDYTVRESLDHSSEIILSRSVRSLGRSYK